MTETRRAIVTGASSGIGRTFALHLAANGYRVTGVARREEQLQQLVSEMPGEHDYCVADFLAIRCPGFDWSALSDCILSLFALEQNGSRFARPDYGGCLCNTKHDEFARGRAMVAAQCEFPICTGCVGAVRCFRFPNAAL